MRLSEFDYHLPAGLIAQEPLPKRTASRLLHLDGATGQRRDLQFADLPDLLRAGDLLVFNDTKVIPARLFARKESGGRTEIFVERILESDRMLAMVKASKAPRIGVRIMLEGGAWAEVVGRRGQFFDIRLTGATVMEQLERHGHLPLPPYIQRRPGEKDAERYQTVFASKPGAVAAPTAGLHFDERMLARLAEKGVESVRVTLHVGAGTFLPVRVDNVHEHHMHAEWVEVSEQAAATINQARSAGRRIIAVGTTAVRSVESACVEGHITAFSGDTRLFIYPGYRFQAIDAMITNFHLPQSTLLMLVCAFAGKTNVLSAYEHAVAERYRFFSYGDAMFVEPELATGETDGAV